MMMTMMVWLVDGLIGVMKRTGEASRFVTLLELTGIGEQLQQMHEFTVFLPSDDAIQVRLVCIGRTSTIGLSAF